MKTLNPEWLKAAIDNINQCPFFELLSMRLLDLAPGSSELEIDVQTKHLQPFGIVHGGVFSTIVDAAGFWAVYADLDEDLGLTTVEMKLNYLAPVTNGRITARGRRIKTGRTIALAESQIENEEGRLLAHGMVTLMTVPGMSPEGPEQGPAKFLG